EGIDYEEVFTPVARIEAIRLFLAYASFMGFIVYQMDVKSSFMYETIEEEVYVYQPLGFEDPDYLDKEEVYVCQPLGFEDPNYPDKVYKVVNALYGLHQAPRVWYETLANYPLENGFQMGKIDQTLFIKKQKGDILLQCKKQTVVATSSTEAEYVVTACCCMFIEDKVSAVKPKFSAVDASEGFDQIIDFLNASSIKFALTVNPNIYVSCIKQFWSSISVKKVNDVMRLQALIDSKKVIITESTVQEALRLDDAESIDCLPNEEIFIELSRMGLMRNVDSSSKFYMYPQFLQLMIRAQVGDLSSHTIKYSSPVLTKKVFPNMRRVGKGFSRVETPLFKGMIVAQQADNVVNKVVTGVDVDDVPATDAEPTPPLPPPTTTPPPPQELPSTSQVVLTLPPSPITQPSSPPQQQQPSQPTIISMDLLNNLFKTYTVVDDLEDASKQREIIANIDADEDLTLKDVAVVAKEVEVEKMQMFRGGQKKAQARKNMIVYLKNMAGFKMDYFKGMSYDDIRPIFEKYFNSNVAFLEKSEE
nr:putative ribonuclease H-like domain-containing protein [Tanacetum cinerariifolium]